LLGETSLFDVLFLKAFVSDLNKSGEGKGLYAQNSRITAVELLKNNLPTVRYSTNTPTAFDSDKLYEKEGAKYHEVYSDHSSDKNSASQKLREGEYDQIKEEMLNPMAIQFQNAVKSARPNLKLDTPGILTGATYPGQKAIDIGLVDKIGTLKDAINYASAQAWARN